MLYVVYRNTYIHVYKCVNVCIKSTQFYTHFSDLSNPNNSKLTSTPTPNHSDTVEQLDSIITLKAVDKSISTLKHHKSPG